jgi:hypothetical protein
MYVVDVSKFQNISEAADKVNDPFKNICPQNGLP